MRNKKALSEIVAYVILITIALSLSVMVYMWLQGYVPFQGSEKDCPDGMALIIKDYSCSKSPQSFNLNLTIQNKGLFTADGFIIKLNDRDDASIGIYTLANSSSRYGISLKPGESRSFQYDLNTQVSQSNNQISLDKLTYIEVIPLLKGSEITYCKTSTSQVVDC
jgi:hypothetical protein